MERSRSRLPELAVRRAVGMAEPPSRHALDVGVHLAEGFCVRDLKAGEPKRLLGHGMRLFLTPRFMHIIRMTNNPSWTIAIGASGAEGLRNLCALVGEWDDLDAAVLVVLHRPWAEVSHLRDVLQRSSRMPVSIAGEGQSLRPGCVYIGEPDNHLTMISGAHGSLTFDPAQSYRNRTVDLLFRSLAEFGAPHVIGIVLEGSLDDGSRGVAAIHDAGGLTMVIEPSAGPPGMPRNAIHCDGPIDVIGDIPTIARAVEAAVL